MKLEAKWLVHLDSMFWLDDWQELFVKYLAIISLNTTSCISPLFEIPPLMYFDKILRLAS